MKNSKGFITTRIFVFLILVGSLFLSTIFQAPIFVFFWAVALLVLFVVCVSYNTLKNWEVLIASLVPYIVLGTLFLTRPWVVKWYAYPNNPSDIKHLDLIYFLAFVFMFAVVVVMGIAGSERQELKQKQEQKDAGQDGDAGRGQPQ